MLRITAADRRLRSAAGKILPTLLARADDAME
jgi:hypothetical protein